MTSTIQRLCLTILAAIGAVAVTSATAAGAANERTTNPGPATITKLPPVTVETRRPAENRARVTLAGVTVEVTSLLARHAYPPGSGAPPRPPRPDVHRPSLEISLQNLRSEPIEHLSLPFESLKRVDFFTEAIPPQVAAALGKPLTGQTLQALRLERWDGSALFLGRGAKSALVEVTSSGTINRIVEYALLRRETAEASPCVFQEFVGQVAGEDGTPASRPFGRSVVLRIEFLREASPPAPQGRL